jgi:hypothetical protein
MTFVHPGQWTVERQGIVGEQSNCWRGWSYIHLIDDLGSNWHHQVCETSAAIRIWFVQSVGGNWVGKYSALHLIHTILNDDETKAVYKSRLHVPSSWMVVKSRRTQAAIHWNVWYMVAENPVFLPITSVKDTHSDFNQPISIPF